ncbi:hypothetical protein BDV06DRAFT_182397 [Aspergillus oleicola]
MLRMMPTPHPILFLPVARPVPLFLPPIFIPAVLIPCVVDYDWTTWIATRVSEAVILGQKTNEEIIHPTKFHGPG